MTKLEIVTLLFIMLPRTLPLTMVGSRWPLPPLMPLGSVTEITSMVVIEITAGVPRRETPTPFTFATLIPLPPAAPRLGTATVVPRMDSAMISHT